MHRPLVAIARRLRRPVVVITPGNTYDRVFREEGYEGEPIFLNYVGDNHYEPLARPQGVTAEGVLNAMEQPLQKRGVKRRRKD